MPRPLGVSPADLPEAVRRAIAPEWRSHLDAAGSIHLAIMVEPFLSHILEHRKTIESRFAKTRTPPFGRVHRGDVVFLKRQSGPVVAFIRVGRVWSLHLDSESWLKVRAFSREICADDDFWAARFEKSYATLLEVVDVCRFEPIDVQKADRRGWVILRDREQQELAMSCAE